MKKTFGLITVLFLIVACIYLAKRSNSGRQSLAIPDSAFALDKDEPIGRIEINSAELGTTILTMKNDYWYVSEKYLARKNAIENLLEVIHGMKVKYIPPASAHQNIRRDLQSIGVSVRVFDGHGRRVIKSYFIGGATQDERGTYAIMNHNSQPYVVHLPNLEGSVRGRFLMQELDWRDRAILDKRSGPIKKITVDYKKDPSESFVLEKIRSRFHLSPLNQSIAADPALANRSLIDNYVAGYDELVAEYIENDNPRKDSIRSLIPFVEIAVEYERNPEKKMRFFPVEDLIYQDQNTMRVDQQSFIRRYFVDCNWGDFMLVQHRLAGKLMRGYSYFLNQ